MMNRMTVSALAGVYSLIATGGCNNLGDIIGGILDSNSITVVLINESGEFDVEADVIYDDEQDLPSSLLREIGQELVFTVGAGETTSFTRDCDDLQAIMIEDADLLVVGAVGPEDSTGVLRDGEDFGCGDTIVFTFTHTELILDFEILTATQ